MDRSRLVATSVARRGRGPAPCLRAAARRALPILVLVALVLPSVAGCGAGDAGEFAASGSASEGGLRGVVLEQPIPKPDFTLLDTEGRPFDFLAETEGYLTLLFFGYTYCPDICPVHLANLAEVLRGMPWEVQSRTRVVFVTLDPARDTPERIRKWLDAFNREFIGLRGTQEEVAAIMNSIGLPPAVFEELPGGDYTVGHASQVIAFSPDGVARVIYPFGIRQADWAHDLPKLVRAEPSIVVRRAFVAQPIADGDRTALYLTLENRSSEPDEVIAARSEVAGRVELHTQIERDGRVTMLPIAGVPLPPGASVRLAPGGDHIMLLELTGPLVAGDTVRAELELRRGGRIPVAAEVRPYGELERVLAEDARDPVGAGREGG